MPQLVRNLILDEAIADIPCETAEVDAAFQQLCQHFHIDDNQEAIQAWMKQQNTTTEQFVDRLARTIRIKKYQEAMWGSKLHSIFLERKSQFDKAVYYSIRTPNPRVAQELYFRLQANEQPFAELASEFGHGQEVHTGGLVGPVLLNSLQPTLKQLLTASKPEQLLTPFKVGKWYFVIRMKQFLPAKLDDELRKTLLTQLCEEWLQQQVSKITVRSHWTLAGNILELWR
ncbi:MAG: peptidylprolyl isomerase [Cyanobacteria bacterium P01_F01_bin.33]